MAQGRQLNIEEIKVYATFWRLMELAVHRYGSYPTGQLLTVLTLLLLDRVDYHPTVGELARITRLPKSTVSRYVSTEMSSGFLEEQIDPEDRRRRLLFPSDRAQQEQGWHSEQVCKIAEQISEILEADDGHGDRARKMIEVLLDIRPEDELQG